MAEKKFGGDKKMPMRTFLAPYEKKLIQALIGSFPRWVEGYHLTLLTLIWSAGLIISGWLASCCSLHWLWLASLMLVLQWFTDCFDGALGRHRDTGIPKWGFYMDHLLDFVFLGALLIGYSFLFQGQSKIILFLLVPVFGSFMASSFLAFGATGEFKITFMGTGPTEMRIWFIILNCCIIFLGTGWLEQSLPYILGASLLFLTIVVYRTQKYIWKIDMADKAARTEDETRE